MHEEHRQGNKEKIKRNVVNIYQPSSIMKQDVLFKQPVSKKKKIEIF